MSAQTWSVNEEGRYLYSDELSKYLRKKLEGTCKFRQFFDAKDGGQKGQGRGDTFNWNIFGNIEDIGAELSEDQPIPESDFSISQNSLRIGEYGRAVPYTGKLDLFTKQPIQVLIDKNLRRNAQEAFDVVSFEKFDQTNLRVMPVNGNSADQVQFSTDGTVSQTNNVALKLKHCSRISTWMRERNIPPYEDESYVCLTRPSVLEKLLDELEDIHKYTDSGLKLIFAGETAMYRKIRYVEQTFIPAGGAKDSTTFAPRKRTGDAWDNQMSSWAFFLGGDTGTEASVLPEQMRAQIPQDFGRSKAICWYGVTGFGITRTDAEDATIVKWDSAA